MSDLYFDDIEDRAYTDAMILADVRALVKSGQREGSLLDYKSDVSEKDNWPATTAAFANSFGGLFVFGVEGDKDQPRRITGFDAKGVEIKTKLTSIIIDRIQPRPEFFVRVVKYDEDPTKEIALLRVEEGRNPPYMYSKEKDHRIYVRMGAQKAEADYLQLSSLLEKRAKTGSESVFSPEVLFGSSSGLHAFSPPHSNLVSQHFLRFVLSPKGLGGLRLNFETERLFRKCLRDVQKRHSDTAVIRSKDVTIFPIGTGNYLEQRFGLATKGGVGFISRPGVTIPERGLSFSPTDFCRFLIDFLTVSSLFYERALRFYGASFLFVNLVIPTPIEVQSSSESDLFHPPLTRITSAAATQIEVAMHPMSANRLQEYVEAAMMDVVRSSGSVPDPKFRQSLRALTDDAVRQLASVRAAHAVD